MKIEIPESLIATCFWVLASLVVLLVFFGLLYGVIYYGVRVLNGRRLFGVARVWLTLKSVRGKAQLLTYNQFYEAGTLLRKDNPELCEKIGRCFIPEPWITDAQIDEVVTKLQESGLGWIHKDSIVQILNSGIELAKSHEK